MRTIQTYEKEKMNVDVAIDPATISEAKRKGKLIEHKDEVAYSCFREKFRYIPRGTVIIGATTIPGYPKIPRVFTLGKGLERNVHSEFVYVEEKIDGYNVRAVKVGNQVFGFSRGGFIDPFATEKLREMGLDSFFRDYPEYVICGEMIGNTPHTPPTKNFDVRFLVFDLMDGNGQFVPSEKKYLLLKKYRLDGVPFIGKFRKTGVKKLKDSTLALNKGKREGIVIKSEDRKEAVKYVLPNADIDDIAKCSHVLFDMPSGFFHQRLLRSAISIKEMRLDRKKYAKELGKAFYGKLIDSLSVVEDGGGICDEFEILVKKPETWDGILKHMGKGVRIELVSRTEGKSGIRIKFKKIYRNSNKKIRGALSGKAFED